MSEMKNGTIKIFVYVCESDQVKHTMNVCHKKYNLWLYDDVVLCLLDDDKANRFIITMIIIKQTNKLEGSKQKMENFYSFFSNVLFDCEAHQFVRTKKNESNWPKSLFFSLVFFYIHSFIHSLLIFFASDNIPIQLL